MVQSSLQCMKEQDHWWIWRHTVEFWKQSAYPGSQWSFASKWDYFCITLYLVDTFNKKYDKNGLQINHKKYLQILKSQNWHSECDDHWHVVFMYTIIVPWKCVKQNILYNSIQVLSYTCWRATDAYEVFPAHQRRHVSCHHAWTKCGIIWYLIPGEFCFRRGNVSFSWIFWSFSSKNV